jgi:hypothetical protein
MPVNCGAALLAHSFVVENSEIFSNVAGMFRTRASIAGFAGLTTTAFIVLATFAACVGDNTPPAGSADGPCLSNGQCNSGLECVTINGSQKCEAAQDGGGKDAASNDSGGNDASDAEAGPRQCTFQPTSFPCPQGPACYGAAQSCSTTGCSGGDSDFRWVCFGPNQCGNTPCCIPDTAATLTPTTDCSLGGLKMTPNDAGTGGLGEPASSCPGGIACPAANITLCQFNTQCPAGTVCSPVKISGSGASASNVIIGACVPE